MHMHERKEHHVRIDGTLGAFQYFVRGEGAVASTAENYARIMLRFAHWLDDNAVVDDIVFELIVAYRSELMNRGLAPKTVGLELSAIRAYCRWAVQMKRLARDPTIGLKWPKMARRAPRALRGAELNTLLAGTRCAPSRLDTRIVRTLVGSATGGRSC
jgi:integrase/recombinase XerC